MSDTATTAVAVQDDTRKSAAIATPAPEKAMIAYSSIKGESFDTRMEILNALSDSKPLAENLGKPLNIRNIIIQNTTLTDRETGEIVDVQRTIFLTEEGIAYHAMSAGAINVVRQMTAALGEPAGWPEPVAATFREEGPKGRKYYTATFGKYSPEAAPKK